MDKLHELQDELDESILDYNYPKAGEVTVKMMIHEATMELHKLNKELIIEMAEKDQLIKELSEENQGLRKIIKKTEVQMDLNKLYKMQAELDKHIIEKHNIQMSEEELLDNTILALLVEVGELANTTRCFKHWSTKGMMDKEIVLDELADVIHFYLSIGNQAGFRWNKMKETNYNPLWNEETNSSLTFIFSIIYIEISAISNDTHNNGGNNNFSYQIIGRNISRLMEVLGFADEEVEQAYLKKHEENYKRQEEGY